MSCAVTRSSAARPACSRLSRPLRKVPLSVYCTVQRQAAAPTANHAAVKAETQPAQPAFLSRRAALSGCTAAAVLLLRGQDAKAEPAAAAAAGQDQQSSPTPGSTPVAALQAGGLGAPAATANSNKLLTDDNLLRMGAVLVGQNSVHSLVAPRAVPDVFDEPTFPQALPESRWTGVLQGVVTGLTLAPTFGGNKESKKNALFVFSAFCAAGAVGHGLVLKNELVDEEKRGLTTGKSIFKAALAVLFLNQALDKDSA